jgi:hypothetical protein
MVTVLNLPPPPTMVTVAYEPPPAAPAAPFRLTINLNALIKRARLRAAPPYRR